MPDEEQMKESMAALGRALKSITQEEKAFLKELKEDIDKAVESDPNLDKQLEFCYGIIFAPDRVKNEPLIKAARQYISAVES